MIMQIRLDTRSKIDIMRFHSTRSRVLHYARVAKLVDAADSKSAGGNTVPVQVRPLVPSLLYEADTKTDESRFFCA